MKTYPSKILFVTSFLPVIVFKVLARVGEVTPERVRVAVVAGLVLAIGQYLLSRHVLKYTTYLEKAFLLFLAGLEVELDRLKGRLLLVVANCNLLCRPLYRPPLSGSLPYHIAAPAFRL